MFSKIGDRWLNPAAVQGVMPHGDGGATIRFTNGTQWQTVSYTPDQVVRMMLDVHLEPQEKRACS